MSIDDYITSRDIGNVANALGVANQIDRSAGADRRAEEQHQRNMTALDRADKVRTDQNTALNYMQKGEQIPEDAGLDPSAVISAKTLNARGRQADATVKQLGMNDAVLSRQNEILANLAKWDGKPMDFLKGVVPETSTDLKALINVRKELGQNDKLAYENMQQLRMTAKVQYEDHRGKMSVADQYLKSGNTMLAEKAVMSAVNDTPHPVYMEKNAQGNYDLYYEEMDQEKEIIPQGKNINLQQAIQLIRSFPPEQAQAVFALDMAAAQDFNANVKPAVWSNPGKKDSVEVFQLKNPLNPTEPQILVFEKDGGRLDGMTVDMLRENGYRPQADLDTRIKQAQLKKAQNEATGNGPKDYKALNQQLDNYKKSMTLVLAPWNKGNEDLTSMDFSDSGTGPLKLAMDYYENNKQSFESGGLKGEDLSKFQNAAEAVRLHKMIRKAVGQMHGLDGPAAVEPDHLAEAMKLAQARDQEGLQDYLAGIKDPAKRKEVISELRSRAGGVADTGPKINAMESAEQQNSSNFREIADKLYDLVPGANDDPSRDSGSVPNGFNKSAFEKAIVDTISGYPQVPGEIRRIAKITGGSYNQKDGSLVFTPTSNDDLRQKLIRLKQAGVEFDATKNQDKSISIVPIQKQPKFALDLNKKNE